MRAPKLVQVMKAKSTAMSEELIADIRASGKCKDLLLKVPESEQRQYALEIYRDLTQWLANETDAVVEERYRMLGARRSRQGVPLSEMFWAVSMAHDHLWEYMEQECLHEEPVEFLGGVILLRSLNRFFQRVLYFALTGYEIASNDQSAALSYVANKRSA